MVEPSSPRRRSGHVIPSKPARKGRGENLGFLGNGRPVVQKRQLPTILGVGGGVPSARRRLRFFSVRLGLSSLALAVALVLVAVQLLTASMLLLRNGTLPRFSVDELSGDIIEAVRPRHMPGLSYSNPSVLLGGCQLTIVLPLWLQYGHDEGNYIGGKMIPRAALRRRSLVEIVDVIQSLESVLVSVRQGGVGESCLLVQTLPTRRKCHPSFWGAGTNSKKIANELEVRAPEGSEVRRWISRGNVRVSELDVGRYAKELGGCDGGTYDFDHWVKWENTSKSQSELPSISNDAVLLSQGYWAEEFLPADSDRVLVVPPGTLFLRPLRLSSVTAGETSFGESVPSPPVEWAYLAAPGKVGTQETCSKPPRLWNDWHRNVDMNLISANPLFPTGKTLCSDPSLFPVDGGSGVGGPSLRSRKWMIRAIEYCPHADFSGLPQSKVASAACRVKRGTNSTHLAPPEGIYFSTLLRGMAHAAHVIRSDAPGSTVLDTDVPLLPTVYQASIFTTNYDALPDFFSADRFGADAQDAIQLAGHQNRSSKQFSDYSIMERKIKSIGTALPIALVEPWKHLSTHVLFGQIIGRNPQLLKAIPMIESKNRNCTRFILNRRCSRKANGNSKLNGNIVYFSITRRAGMRDVRSVLQQLGNIAASLCARLVVRPPGQMLDYERHNAGVQIPDYFPHSDYTNMTSRMHWSDGGKHVGWDESDEPVILDNVTVEEARLYGISEAVDVYIDTNASNANSVFDQYMQAMQAMEKGQTFVWGIHKSIYELRDKFMTSVTDITKDEVPFLNTSFPLPHLNHKVGGCNYVNLKTNARQERAVSEFLDRAGIASSENVTYTPLHIRRGDLAHTCNSSLAALESYLKCSYSRCPLRPSSGNVTTEGRKPIILFTDEMDPTYIASVLGLLRTYALGSLHGDPLLRKILYPKGLSSQGQNASSKARSRRRGNVRDNFFLFAVAEIITKKAPVEKRLIRHRNRCNTCDSIC
mmetsp:Transcript_57665/g.172053  ORF Transcript_57665/g.172053 Transcript_57665/m.172053 type:complete len:983 (-) Transcript_57665:253-3201(-)